MMSEEPEDNIESVLLITLSAVLFIVMAAISAILCFSYCKNKCSSTSSLEGETEIGESATSRVTGTSYAQAFKSKPSSREKSTVCCNIVDRLTLADFTDQSEFTPPKTTVRQAVTPPRVSVRPAASQLISTVRPAVDCCQCKRPVEPEILELLKMDLDAPCLLHAMVYLSARIKPQVFEEVGALKPKSPVSKENLPSWQLPMKSSRKINVEQRKKCLECEKRVTRIKSRMLKDYKLEKLLMMLEQMNQRHYEWKLFKCSCLTLEREALGSDWCKCFESLSSETCHPIASEDHSRKHTKSQCSCSGNVCKYQKPSPPKAKALKKNRKSCNPTTCNEDKLCEPGPSSSTLGSDWCKCFESLSSETCHPITSEDHSRKHTKSQCSCSGNVCKYQKPPPPKAKADKKNQKSCNPTTCNEEELCEPGPSSSSTWLSEVSFERKRKSRRRSMKRERKRRESRRKKRKRRSHRCVVF